MADETNALQNIVRTRILRLNAIIQGIVTGIMAGLGLFITTNWLVIKGGEVVGPHLALLNQFFIGYEVTFVGSLIGLTYGFVFGFGTGFLIATVYNRLVDIKARQ